MADAVDPFLGAGGAARLRIAIAVTVIVVAAGCAVGPASSPSAAPNGALSSEGAGGGAGAGDGGGAGSGGGGAGGGGGGAGGGGGGAGAGSSYDPGSVGPFVVKQIESLGGETISGFVCRTSSTFAVNASTSKAAWTFVFVPGSSTAGRVSYAYSIPSAGESHSANGTYTITRLTGDTTLHLSLQVSDHVVFKGFDGNIPLRYKFDLVPGQVAGC